MDFTNVEVKLIHGELELYLSTDLPCNQAIPKFIESKNITNPKQEKCKMEWGINDLGIVHFGLLYEDKNLRPGSNSHWSSNSEAFEHYTGILTIPCCIIPKESWKMATHIMIDKVKEILPEGYLISLGNYGGYKIFKH